MINKRTKRYYIKIKKNKKWTYQKYSNMLIAWAELTLQSDLSFHGGSSKYNTAGGVARQKIIDDFNWTITDGGAEW